jgi:hypothetical protein
MTPELAEMIRDLERRIDFHAQRLHRERAVERGGYD